jgi:UDP-N-acetylmuramyl tripeptide synthase
MLSKSSLQVILVAGTNGKTTTAKLIHTVLQENGKKVLQNQSGANLLNGIASTMILNANFAGKLQQDFAIFEVDENTLPQILDQINPGYLLLLNLFRDQLDRYGEVDSIVRKWKEALQSFSKETTLILNADDPQIAYLGNTIKNKNFYFGLEKKWSTKSSLDHAADSIYCPICGNKLHYNVFYYSHLGEWSCPNCGLKRPSKQLLTNFSFYPLPGTYNAYNTLAAVAVLKQIGLRDKEIVDGLKKFQPAFGRQEKIRYENKNIQIFLSKNPTGFNESLQTIEGLGAKSVLLVLNDRIADGRDVSWIWDIDLEKFFDTFEHIFVSGDRAYDLGLRIKYAGKSEIGDQKLEIFVKLEEGILKGLSVIKEDETLFILPTYTAMLETRKILTGKSIL